MPSLTPSSTNRQPSAYKEPEPVAIAPQPLKAPALKGSEAVKVVTNTWFTRMVIRETVTGRVYDFPPNGTLEVDAKDVARILGLQRTQGGCCGGEASTFYYFKLEA